MALALGGGRRLRAYSPELGVLLVIALCFGLAAQLLVGVPH